MSVQHLSPRPHTERKRCAVTTILTTPGKPSTCLSEKFTSSECELMHSYKYATRCAQHQCHTVTLTNAITRHTCSTSSDRRMTLSMHGLIPYMYPSPYERCQAHSLTRHVQRIIDTPRTAGMWANSSCPERWCLRLYPIGVFQFFKHG